MIKNLTGRATFKVTGATIVVEFQPKNGITAVVGPNGSGKTFTALESLRYLMFGSKALRGVADEYSLLEMKGEVTIGSFDYQITRGKKPSISLAGAEDQLAVGADETTKKVVELLGYGLDVFDICNASIQGETGLFGKMRPTARKAMIDQVVGLTATQQVEKACRDEAAGYRRDADTIVRTLRQPGEAPVAPLSYVSSKMLKLQLAAAREQRAADHKLRITLTNPLPPTAPGKTMIGEDAVLELESHEDKRKARVHEEAHFLSIINRGPAMQLTEEQIVEAENRYAWEQLRELRGPKPTIPLEQVEKEIAIWEQIGALMKLKDQEIECPKCGHQFNTRPDLPDSPANSSGLLQSELIKNRSWANPLASEPTSRSGSMAPQEAREYRQGCRAVAQAQEAIDALGPPLEDKSKALATARQEHAAWNHYLLAQLNYERATKVDQEVQAKLKKLEPVPTEDEVYDLADRMSKADQYESATLRHDAEVEAFKAAMLEVANKETLAEAFKEGSAQLSDARATLKAYLAPALSRVASSLIADMTNGKLNSIVVDEEMDILVDGQRLETLSGAGASVANIALRVALGRVLVGKTFPVFIGDEMDGDLDAERREATIQAMVSLKDHLKQIILITHRSIDVADHVIDLGESE